MDPVGAYAADRAAALSGVPKSTIHWWARHDVLVPSVSATRVMLWSYADLMGLRVANDGFDLAGIQRSYPYVSPPQISQALELERQLDDNVHKRAA